MLTPTEIPPPSADWKVLGKDKDVFVPVVTDSITKVYQKAKYAGAEGQNRKAYRMFSSRRTVSVKILKDKNNYSGNTSRPVTMQFFENKLVKAYCSCPVGKSGLCCHAIALLIQLKFFLCDKKLHLHMTCTERLQKWHACSRIHSKSKAASQVKLKYVRNPRGARTDIKQTRQEKKVQFSASAEYDYSDWYGRGVPKIEEGVKEKVDKLHVKPVESNFYSVVCEYKKESPLFLHLRYKTEYQNKEAGREYNEEVLKPRFKSNAEAVWRPQKLIESHQSITSVTAAGVSEIQDSQKEPTQKSNYVPVDQSTSEWRALSVGVITARKAPALLGLCGIKKFDNAWFAIKNNIDETMMNPGRAKLPNFVREKQEEKNAITRFCIDSKSVVTQCGYFKHPLDNRSGASPDGVSCCQDVFLVEIKTHSLPNKKQPQKLTQGEQQVKIEDMQTPLQRVSKKFLSINGNKEFFFLFRFLLQQDQFLFAQFKPPPYSPILY